VRDNVFHFDVPFMTKRDIVELMNANSPHVRLVKSWTKFTPANLGNLIQRGLFAPERKPKGLRNLLYSGRDLLRLTLLVQAAGYGFPLQTAVRIADEGMRCYDECPAEDDPSEERVNLNRVEAPYLAVRRPALEGSGENAKILDAVEVVSPLSELQVGLALKAASSLYVVDWTKVASCAMSLATDRWRLKAQDLIEKHGRRSATT
jgi:hypothetical protein